MLHTSIAVPEALAESRATQRLAEVLDKLLQHGMQETRRTIEESPLQSRLDAVQMENMQLKRRQSAALKRLDTLLEALSRQAVQGQQTQNEAA